MPSVPGVEIEAYARPRVRSGDYDIQLSPTHIAIAIADISGRNSAARLDGATQRAGMQKAAALSMAELVSRLNKHLSNRRRRFATFFIAINSPRTLRYTKRGPAAFLICNAMGALDKGGMGWGCGDTSMGGMLTVVRRAADRL